VARADAPAAETAWELASAPADAAALATAAGLPPWLGALLVARGADTAAAARRFVQPRLADVRPPDTMAGLAPAAARLAAALRGHERIGVFGDYDVDGVSSAALTGDYLRACGGDVLVRVGQRASGYGLAEPDAAALLEAGCAVAVVCDCGTSDHDSVAQLRAAGVDVIVVDHHQVPDPAAPATILVNPQQPCCAFPFKGLAAVGLCFYLCAALRTALKHERAAANGSAGLPPGEEPDPREWLDLVALGTVADMAPLVGENRILVSHGLKVLGRGRRPGLRALADLAGIADHVRAEDIAFRLAPRLNAPGRLGDATPALGVLLEPDLMRARALAAECDAANRSRQVLQESVYAAAVADLDRRPPGPVVVVAGQGWHPGVVGIVAAKLVDRYGVPAAVIALDGAVGRGSARTVPGFHLYEALRACAPHLVRYGGHAAAAGMTVEATQVDELRVALEEAARVAFPAGPAPRPLRLDAELPLGAITRALCEEVALLEPFGIGNPEPQLCTRGLQVLEQRLVGEREDHLLLTLSDGACELRAIGFRLAPSAPGVGAIVDVAYVPEVDEYRGTVQVRLRLRDLRPAARPGGAHGWTT
jgi:single-stranded-DNA-specific exonuclease